jgi:hypothetical protein
MKIGDRVKLVKHNTLEVLRGKLLYIPGPEYICEVNHVLTVKNIPYAIGLDNWWIGISPWGHEVYFMPEDFFIENIK